VRGQTRLIRSAGVPGTISLAGATVIRSVTVCVLSMGQYYHYSRWQQSLSISVRMARCHHPFPVVETPARAQTGIVEKKGLDEKSASRRKRSRHAKNKIQKSGLTQAGTLTPFSSSCCPNSPFAYGEADFASFRGQIPSLFRVDSTFFSPRNTRRRSSSYGGQARNVREKVSFWKAVTVYRNPGGIMNCQGPADFRGCRVFRGGCPRP